MFNVPSGRLTVPKAVSGEILRENLLNMILKGSKKFSYIHAGAGYGKTTLLSQVANRAGSAVWLSLDGENDVFTFVHTLCEAVRQAFPEFSFTVSEYLPFSEKDNFINLLADALICSLENLARDFWLVLDDLQTIEERKIKKLIIGLIRYAPAGLKFAIGSREAPWQDFLPFAVRGNFIELAQKDLAFTREEVTRILGFDDEALYAVTEGWPLAVSSFKVLLENGISLSDIPVYGNDALYAYLFHEYIGQLNPGMVDFLKKSACFDELDAPMLDNVLNKKNTRLILENLVSRNIFTIKTSGGFYRYHALFRNSLLEGVETSQKLLLQRQAARYYFEQKRYAPAARYTIEARDGHLLEKIILACYRDFIRIGNYNELRLWFQALDDMAGEPSPGLLAAKGAFLSVVGNFVRANECLDAAIPLLGEADKELYFETMLHKARVLRNFVSFAESNTLLDRLIAELDSLTSELAYNVIIEKIYNLCWNSQINEAYTLISRLIETCAQAGNLKLKAWYERYLSVVHFIGGRMKEAVYYYEKSLALPENERQYLSLHNVDIAIAKAYQMLGERNKAVAMITAALQTLRTTGRYEELWLGYLFAAEIHYQNTFIDRMNGGNPSFETTLKYFMLADEYAPLYRQTAFQLKWAKMQRNIYSLIFNSEPNPAIINEIWADLDQVGDYFKTIALARLASYFSAVADFPNAVSCAKLCIAIGERSKLMLMPACTYGILARAAVMTQDRSQEEHAQAVALTRRFLQLSEEYGAYEYFRMRKAYDPILEFALANGIKPEFTRQMMAFSGYKLKKVYVQSLGAFTVYQDSNGRQPVKLRSRKERELLAFLLAAGEQGVTKEEIYHAIWWDSESTDVKKLIAVNLSHIKSDLARLGIEKSVISHDNRYAICKDEIASDLDLLAGAYEDFQLKKTKEQAKRVLALYKGEYLADFEALWATTQKIRYREIYEEALRCCL